MIVVLNMGVNVQLTIWNNDSIIIYGGQGSIKNWINDSSIIYGSQGSINNLKEW